MKTKALPCLLAASIILIAGCLPSLHPFYTSKDLIKDDRLIGAFGEDKPESQPDETWTFSAADEDFYQLEMSAPKKEEPGKINVVGRMEARLFKLGKQTCLDLKPTHDLLENEFSGWYQTSFIAGHVLFKVLKIDDQALTLSRPDYEWISKHLEKNPGALAHKRDDGRLILTDSTARLQAFFLKHDKEIWGDPGKMVRLKN